jgi:nicotinate phosphoribosyltransferase
MLALSRDVRQILDAAGFHHVRIFASGGLDEDEIDRLLGANAPIDAFGVGTRMNVSADAPYLDMAYKLVRYGGRDVLKLSTGKVNWTDSKQVFRLTDSTGRFTGDVVALHDEPAPPGATPLLIEVMRGGGVTVPHPPLAEIRERCARQVAALPEPVRRLRHAEPNPVRFSERLTSIQKRVEAQVRAAEL